MKKKWRAWAHSNPSYGTPSLAKIHAFLKYLKYLFLKKKNVRGKSSKKKMQILGWTKKKPRSIMLIASQRDSVLGQIIGPNPRLDEEDNRLWLQIMISPPQRTANYDCNYSNEILKQKKKVTRLIKHYHNGIFS